MATRVDRTPAWLRRRDRLEVSAYQWLVSSAWLAVVGFAVAQDGSTLARHSLDLLPWIALQTAAGFMPISGYRQSTFTSGFPVSASAATILSPVEAGLVLFLGSSDLKELRRQVTFTKAIFNRSQLAITAATASIVVRTIVPDPLRSRWALILGLASLAVQIVANYSFVSLSISLEHRMSLISVVKQMRIGSPVDFAITIIAWCGLVVLLIASYTVAGAWALLAFLAPTILARQVLVRSQMWVETTEAYKWRGEALIEMTKRIADERSDERRLIAADLHDEVLQPLFKVTLMAHVLKTDLARGRLLDIDDDLPDLLAAAELASNSLRDLIGDLRRSTLGRRGISEAMRTLVQSFSQQSTAKIKPLIAEVDADSVYQLVVYQVAKEALTNAISHSNANNITVELRVEDDSIRLEIQDDGVGFDPTTERPHHYGIHIMRERASSIGGSLYLDSALGQGCKVLLLIPQ